MTRRFIMLSAALAVAGLSACSPGAGEQPSSACTSAMAEAAAETDAAAANPLIVATLSACGGAAEWLAALDEHPGAMGLTDQAELGDIELQSACWGHEGTPVCADAVEQGRVPAN